MLSTRTSSTVAMSALICSIATCPAACGRPRLADLRQHPSRNTRAGRSISMHATVSLADGVVDPVIASRGKLEISRASRRGDPGVEERRTTRGRRYALYQPRDGWSRGLDKRGRNYRGQSLLAVKYVGQQADRWECCIYLRGE